MAITGNSEEEFLQRLRSTFRIEAEEHISAVSLCLHQLESLQGGADITQLETIFRHVHSLKGAARAVNVYQVEKICQVMESLFSKWKSSELNVPLGAFDALYAALDLIKKAIPDSSGSHVPDEESRTVKLLLTLERLGASPETSTLGAAVDEEKFHNFVGAGGSPEFEAECVLQEENEGDAAITTEDNPVQSMVAATIPDTASTVRVSTAKLDQLLLQAEEMLTVKTSISARSADVKTLDLEFKHWEKVWAQVQPAARELTGKPLGGLEKKAQTLAVPTNTGPGSDKTAFSEGTADSAKLDNVMDFLEWNSGFIRALTEKIKYLAKDTDRDQTLTGRLVDGLVTDSKNLLMLPFVTAVDVLPKLVRDLAREQGKEIDLAFEGQNMEVDKRILEAMKDPLIHLLRNCVDHGIEKPAHRVQNGKPQRGTIAIKAFQSGADAVELTVSDDGAGLNLEKVKASAVKRGIISAAEAETMTDQEVLPLIFQSQVSTTQMVTEISGRGLGLAIVQETVQKLGGHIKVETGLHSGTLFRIVLPRNFATVNGLFVRAANQTFVFPTSHVDRVTRVASDDVKLIQNRETICLLGKTISLVRIRAILGGGNLDNAPAQNVSEFPVVVVCHGDDCIAFAVDEVLHVEEVLAKQFSKPLLRVKNLMGATTLASGKVIPILNLADLMKSAHIVQSISGTTTNLLQGPQKPTEIKRILLAEDSITSRMLLKGILESAGYAVHTAVDGIEAITTLRTSDFDLVVSDVEMPRMNGFDLTIQIRNDQRLADTPVVLVTALSAQADRERGIDVGANAYIVKSSFDQSDLLAVVSRLI